MAEMRGESCLLRALLWLALGGLFFGFLLWLNTRELVPSIIFAFAATLIAVGVFLFFWLPLLFYALGRYIGGRIAGMRLWTMVVGPMSIYVGRDGVRRTEWSWRWGVHNDSVMLPVRLDRPERQIKFYCLGGVYGCVFAVAVYGGLALWLNQGNANPIGLVVMFLPVIPVLVQSSRCSRDVDRVRAQANVGGYQLAFLRLSHEEWMGVRPRQWDRDALAIYELPIDDKNYRLDALGRRFSFWNDEDPGGVKLREARDGIVVAMADVSMLAETRDVYSSMLAYYSAVYDRDAVEARRLLGDKLDLSPASAVNWRNASILAVHVLEGRMEEAEALRDRMMEAGREGGFGEYVEEHVSRVMRLGRAEKE